MRGSAALTLHSPPAPASVIMHSDNHLGTCERHTSLSQVAVLSNGVARNKSTLSPSARIGRETERGVFWSRNHQFISLHYLLLLPGESCVRGSKS